MSPEPIKKTSSALAADENFDYVIKRQRRKTLALHVLADASVEVRAPKWVSKYEVAIFVEQRVQWVIQRRRIALERLALKPKYAPGYQHFYLGQRYPLMLMNAQRTSVRWNDGHWLIAVSDSSDSQMVEKALWNWYRKQAGEIFEERLFACYEAFPDWFQDKFPMPALSIRKMKRRWGSCSSKGDITLNLVLVKMPVECIDYVVCHELCHLEVFHHGKPFYQLLSQVLPDWRQREQLIERFSDS